MLRMNEGKTFELAGTIWRVLDKMPEGYLCIADSIGDKRFGNNNNWKESSLRRFLNTEFLEKIENEIGQGMLVEFERNLLSLDGQTEYGTCRDKVSLISFDEYRKYRALLPNTGYWWWTLTPDSTKCNGNNSWMSVVAPSGDFSGRGYYGDYGVRPFCIFSSSLFESGEN